MRCRYIWTNKSIFKDFLNDGVSTVIAYLYVHHVCTIIKIGSVVVRATTKEIEVHLHTVSEAIILAATISVRWGVGHNTLFWCFLILPFYNNFIAPSSREWLHLTRWYDDGDQYSVLVLYDIPSFNTFWRWYVASSSCA